MNLLKNSDTKYLIELSNFENKFNDLLKNDKYNEAYNILYDMRKLHGKIITEYSLLDFKEDNEHKYFNASHMSSTIFMFNQTIIKLEFAFNKYIDDNNVNLKDLKIKDDSSNVLSNSTKNDIEKNLNSLSSDDQFNKDLPSFILFYDPRCPACLQTKPHWDTAILSLNKPDKVINIFEFNLSDKSNEYIGNLFKVEYIPTIILMEPATKPKAKIEKLVGKRSQSDIESFFVESFKKFTKSN
jgi:hypothetical protein